MRKHHASCAGIGGLVRWWAAALVRGVMMEEMVRCDGAAAGR